MDWGRSKTILIVSFLLLNVFLGYQLIRIQADSTSTNASYDQSAYSITELLKVNQIRLLGDIPTQTPKMNDLVVEYTENARPFIDLDKPIKANTVIFKNDTITDKIAKQIDDAKSYKLDIATSSSTVYVMNQIYKDKPLFNSKMHLYLEKGVITKYQQMKGTVIESDNQKFEQVMSAGRALKFLIENYLPQDTVIQSIELGYYGQAFETTKQVLAPNWRFVLEDGTQYFVHAFYGEVAVVQKEKE